MNSEKRDSKIGKGFPRIGEINATIKHGTNAGSMFVQFERGRQRGDKDRAKLVGGGKEDAGRRRREGRGHTNLQGVALHSLAGV